MRHRAPVCGLGTDQPLFELQFFGKQIDIDKEFTAAACSGRGKIEHMLYLRHTFAMKNPVNPVRLLQFRIGSEQIASESLLQMNTECGLGLDNKIVGITKYCVHPKEKIKNKTIVGGVQNLNFVIIKNLKPDLIIANKEENDKDEITKLSKNHNVWISHVEQFDEALALIKNIGELTNKIEEAKEINKKIISKFYNNKIAPKNIKVAYLIWKNPYIASEVLVDDAIWLRK